MINMVQDEVIAGILEGYQRTNLQELNLSEQDDLAKRVGMILRQAPYRHQLFNSSGFDPVQLQFLRKMISSSILEKKIRVIRKDYFAAVLYLDFFTRFVVEDSDITETMLRRTRQLEHIDPFLDPNLELCIRCCALEYMADYRPLAHNDRRRNHYNHSNEERSLEYTFLRRIDPIYEAAGQLFLEQFNVDAIKERLGNVFGINDLAAMVFTDMNLSLYKSHVRDRAYKRVEREAVSLIDSGETLKAAHLTIDNVARNVSRQPMSSYIATMQPTRY